MPGAYDGETVTRRMFFTGGVMAAGGIATAAFTLPALGFALGPIFTRTDARNWQDVGSVKDFNPQTYTSVLITIDPNVGETGKSTAYIRKRDPSRDTAKELARFPYVAISTRCMHLGCPVRYVQAAQRFICPCHGGVYQFDGKVAGGPPVRPLDRFETKVENGHVFVGHRFSVNSKLEKFAPRDPSNHLDGLWQYLYPARPTT